MNVKKKRCDGCFEIEIESEEAKTAFVRLKEEARAKIEELVVPDTVLGYEVLGILPRGIACCPCLKSVSLPLGLRVLWDNAFADCDALENIVFPPSLRCIGESVFSSCESLETVDLSATSLRRIGLHAFAGCTALKKVLVPEGVEEIGLGAFEWSPSTELLKEDHNVYLGTSSCPRAYLLRGNKNIQGELHLHPEVKLIAAGAFEGARGIKKIVFHEGLRYIGDYAFAGCWLNKEISLPESLLEIGSYAFAGNEELLKVEGGSEELSVLESAFATTPMLPKAVKKDLAARYGKDIFHGEYEEDEE